MSTNPPSNTPHQAAWDAAQSGAATTAVHGAVISSPTVAVVPPNVGKSLAVTIPETGAAQPTLDATPPADAPPKDGFLLSGKIANLFGLVESKLEAEFYSYHGPIPDGVTLPDGVTTPIYQIATIKDDLKLSTILPKLEGTTFDNIPLKNVVFTYQNCVIDPSKQPGFYINADIVFDESFGAVHHALATVLGIPNPTLHIQGGLGPSQSFNSPLNITSFLLSGSFADVVIQPCSGLTLSAIGVELYGYQGIRYKSDWTPYMGMQYGFGIFGSVLLGLDHSLNLSFDITDVGGGQLGFSATQFNSWENALGISGLVLGSFTLHTNLDCKTPMKSFSFDVSATLDMGDSIAVLSGSHSSDGSFSINAQFTNLGIAGISNLFDCLHADSLAAPKLDVQIGTATLTIASGGIFSLNIQDLSIEHYTGVNASIDFSPQGAIMKASLVDDGSGTPAAPGEKTLTFGDIEIEKAYLQVSFATEASGKSTDVILGGELHWQVFTLDAGVHLYRTANPTSTTPATTTTTTAGGATGSPATLLHWTVFADFVTAADAQQGLPLSNIVPELKGSFLGDITLEDAALIVASQDDPEFGSYNTTAYPVNQGFQVCAILGLIKPLSDIMRVTDPPRLILSAGWSKVAGFALDILMPSPMTINLGKGIVTDPFSLQIRTVSTSPSIIPPTFQLNAGVKIPTANSPEPLHFTLSLAFNALEGSATGEMTGYWVNPFGLSPKLQIGPDVALTIGIIIEEMMISPFGFQGGLKIGDVTAQVAFEVSEIPSQELLYSEVENFHITDLVYLARDITQLPIPMIPDFMIFKDIKFYVCPAGVTIGSVVYQRGCQFSADMLIFGQEAEVSVVVDGKSIIAKSSLDNMKLGALHITGIDGPKATSDVEISPDKQYGSVQGKITLYDLEVLLNLEFEFKPDPFFHFDFLLQFTPHLTFTVNANMIGKITNVHDISNIDFDLVAVMQQDILDYMAKAINDQFDRASKAEKADIGAQKEKVDAAKKSVDDDVKAKQTIVDKAYTSWKTKSDAVNAQFTSATNVYNNKMKELQGQVDAATAKYKTDLANAQHKLTAANADRASKMQAAKTQVAKANQDCTQKINTAQGKLNDATRDMNSRFGDAEKKIKDAENGVNSIQGKINDVDRKINDLKHLHGIKAIGKAGLPALYTAKGTLEASMKTADGVLTAAKGVLTSSNYISAQGVMKAAQGTLVAAEATGHAGIKASEATLAATDKVTAATVDAASSSLTQVGKVGPAAIEVASKSLNEFRTAGMVAVNAAKSSVDALSKCGEYIAWQSALAGLKIAQSSTQELDLANGALEVVEKGGAGIMQAADYVATHAITFVDIHYIRVQTQFGKAAGGAEFAATVQGSVAGKAFAFDTTYDPRKTTEFITNTFHKLLDEVKGAI